MIKARPEVEAMTPYVAPLEGRRSLLRLDFNESTVGPSPAVVDAIRRLPPDAYSTYPEYADLEIRSTPYRDLIAKEYPIIVKMQRGECRFEDLDQEDMVIVGDVDHCVRKIERYRDAGLDHFIALMQADRIPHEKVMRSIELFGTEIIPRFRK